MALIVILKLATGFQRDLWNLPQHNVRKAVPRAFVLLKPLMSLGA